MCYHGLSSASRSRTSWETGGGRGGTFVDNWAVRIDIVLPAEQLHHATTVTYHHRKDILTAINNKQIPWIIPDTVYGMAASMLFTGDFLANVQAHKSMYFTMWMPPPRTPQTMGRVEAAGQIYKQAQSFTYLV